MDDAVFRSAQPTAWTYHRATARWIFSPLAAGDATPRPGRETVDVPWTPLPPTAPLTGTLAGAVGDRVSCRAFTDAGLDLDALAALLRCGYGILGRSETDTVELLDRPAPSAGGLYPLELSVVVRHVHGLPPGVHHYVPAADGLERLRDGPIPARLLTYLFMGQPWVSAAAVVLVLSAVTGRSLTKYSDRGYRYLLIEAGHVGQNLVLGATALGLGSVCLGGFHDDELAGLLRLDHEREIPLYAVAVGVPAATDRMGRRALPEP